MNNAVSKAMKEKTEEGLTVYENCQNGTFRLEKVLMIYSYEFEGGRCMRGSDGWLCLCKKERSNIWKDYMERIMNEVNDWHHNVK